MTYNPVYRGTCMKRLLYTLILINQLILASEHDKEYTKNTCHRTYWGDSLSTDKEREQCSECQLSRFEVYDKDAQKHIAHIAYKPSECCIAFLRVDEKYQKQGIGAELAQRALEDMRVNHRCQAVSLTSAGSAEGFWEKLGAKSKRDFTHVFPDALPNNYYYKHDRVINLLRKGVDPY